MSNGAYALQTRGLSRKFAGRPAVNGVTISVPHGAIYGFLGPNGAGKTTTLKMVLGLLVPDAGEIHVDGIDLLRKRREAASRLGALLEANSFYPNISGRLNLALTARLLGVEASEIDRVLDIVELRNEAGRRVSELSLGMRQRLGIARALLGRPRLLIFDEPTNGLDPDGIADMRRFLKRLPGEAGTTILLSSHLLSEVEQIVSHLGIIQKGRLTWEGTLDEVKQANPGNLVIETDHPVRAASIAGELGFKSRAILPNHILSTPNGLLERGQIAALNAALVQAGVSVFAMTPESSSLEDFYQASLFSGAVGGSSEHE